MVSSLPPHSESALVPEVEITDADPSCQIVQFLFPCRNFESCLYHYQSLGSELVSVAALGGKLPPLRLGSGSVLLDFKTFTLHDMSLKKFSPYLTDLRFTLSDGFSCLGSSLIGLEKHWWRDEGRMRILAMRCLRG